MYDLKRYRYYYAHLSIVLVKDMLIYIKYIHIYICIYIYIYNAILSGVLGKHPSTHYTLRCSNEHDKQRIGTCWRCGMGIHLWCLTYNEILPINHFLHNVQIWSAKYSGFIPTTARCKIYIPIYKHSNVQSTQCWEILRLLLCRCIHDVHQSQILEMQYRWHIWWIRSNMSKPWQFSLFSFLRPHAYILLGPGVHYIWHFSRCFASWCPI